MKWYDILAISGLGVAFVGWSMFCIGFLVMLRH